MNSKKIEKKRTLNGIVVSNKMQKTVIVRVLRKYAHPLYKRTIKEYKRYKAHTDKEFKVGQSVKIQECRPISKEKTWRVVEILD